METQTITIAATFTADLLEGPLAFWMQEVQIPSRIVVAPFDQLFQQLLDPNSLLNSNDHGINVVLLRLEDWRRPQTGESPAEFKHHIEQVAREFVAALIGRTERSTVPHFVVLCPASPRCTSDAAIANCLNETEQWIVGKLSNQSGVFVSTDKEVELMYSTGNIHDAGSDELGRIPYTPEFFSALGTFLARKIHAQRSLPCKVIAVDCDDTLWTGVCGEVGPNGIEVTPARRQLQQFLVDQVEAGTLVCICSKNNDEDVALVFDNRFDMRLQRKHIAAWRVNWKAKSANLRSLASELGLGLDSFVFLDDNPVECAEVQANCPAVLTLQLPKDELQFDNFLRNVWTFDRLESTKEDRLRASSYHDQTARELIRKESTTMADFMARLELNVRIFEPPLESLTRVAQLTQRTNQFNCTTIRRTEPEVRQLHRTGELKCLAVDVSDRFGDYGLVGVVFYRITSTALEVDTFLLSCRVLGRGVEHQVLNALGDMAKQANVSTVRVPFTPTPKNRPALDFLTHVIDKDKSKCASACSFDIPADVAAKAEHNGELPSSPSEHNGEVHAVEPHAPTAAMNRIASELNSVESVHRAIVAWRRKSRSSSPIVHRDDFVTPNTPVEKTLAGIWTEVLGIEQISLNDNFFQLGGDSLLATQVVSRLWGAFHVYPPLSILFDSPTVSGLADAVVEAMTHRVGGEDMEAMLNELENTTVLDLVAKAESE